MGDLRCAKCNGSLAEQKRARQVRVPCPSSEGSNLGQSNKTEVYELVWKDFVEYVCLTCGDRTKPLNG